MTANDLDNSAILDLHTWSDYKEVDDFIDNIHEQYFATLTKPIEKKHVKFLLLNLYINWTEDPTRYLAVPMSPNEYKGKSRYNALKISKKTIDIVNLLVDVGLIDIKLGFYYRPTGKGKLTRISPTEELIDLFKEALFPDYLIGTHEDRETVILRGEVKSNKGKKAKEDIEYNNTHNTNRMRKELKKYNTLLKKTFIDIPEVSNAVIDVGKDGKKKLVWITPRDKFVRRIFNNSSWDQGGRFYGGWWQRIPTEWRRKIHINNMPVVEDDFSSLHIALLYALEGEDFYKDYEDPYGLTIKEINDPVESRAFLKLLFLISINASDEKKAFAAMRDIYKEKDIRFKSWKDTQYQTVLDQLKAAHPKIAHKICSGAGIDLMNVDAEVSSIVINEFTKLGIPVLCIHDSYVVQYDKAEQLRNLMVDAIAKVTGKIDQPMIERDAVTKSQKSWYKAMMKQDSIRWTFMGLVERTPEYKDRLNKHDAYMKVLDPNWTPKQPSVKVIKNLYGTDTFAGIVKQGPEEEHRTLELIRSLNELPDKQ